MPDKDVPKHVPPPVENAEIKQARDAVTDAAKEHERAHRAYIVTGNKLQAAQERLAKLLAKNRL